MILAKKLTLLAGTLAFNSSAVMQQASEFPPVYSITVPVPPPFNEAVQTAVADFNGDFKWRVKEGRNKAQFNKCFSRESASGQKILYDADAVKAVRASYQQATPNYNFAPIIVLDPGHGHQTSGGKYDTGAINKAYGLQEAEVIDALIAPLKDKLRSELHAQVVTTRNPIAEGISLTDKYRFHDQKVALQYRAELAAAIQKKFPEYPIIFISVHVNSGSVDDGDTNVVAHPNLNGGEIFYYENSGPQDWGADLAQNIAENYRIRPGSSTAVKTAGFAVLRCGLPASVLLETGYLTGSKDAGVLKAVYHDPDKAGELAGMIARGVSAYLQEKRMDKNSLLQIMVASKERGPKI